LADLGVDHRLPATDADDGRAAFIDRRQAFGNAQSFLDRLDVLADASTARAGEIAGMERLEHQYEWKSLDAFPFLASHVDRHVRGQRKGETHVGSYQFSVTAGCASPCRQRLYAVVTVPFRLGCRRPPVRYAYFARAISGK